MPKDWDAHERSVLKAHRKGKERKVTPEGNNYILVGVALGTLIVAAIAVAATLIG